MMIPELFKVRRFLPLFVTQFIGAFNDNFFKNAMLILITYKLFADQPGGKENALMLVNLAGGVFILPFFLFSAPAGQLADKYDRAMITRLLKIWEILLMALAGLALMLHMLLPVHPFWQAALLLTALFMAGTQSAFFGPIKYALLPQHLKETELIAGNAYVEAATYVAILLGTIVGSILIMRPHGELLVTIGLLALAVIGYLTSRAIPEARPPVPTLKVNWNIPAETWSIWQGIKKQLAVYRCILAISWFWAIGVLILSQLPGFCKDFLGADETVVTYFLTIFTVGIGLGSVLCNRLLKGVIQPTYVPLGALGLSVFVIDLYFASRNLTPGHELISLAAFLKQPSCWRLTADMFLLAGFGGIFIVPLYTIMQHRADPAQMARVVAGNNIMNALFMVGAAVGAAAAVKAHYTIPQIFLIGGLLNLLVGLYICKLLPDALIRSLVRSLLMLLFRVEVKNPENFAKAGDRVLIIANHTSLLDGILLGAFIPERVMLAINTQMAQKWWIKPWLYLADAFPMDPTKPLSIRTLIAAISSDRKCMIFPEGRITVTGSLMKVYEGPGMIAAKSGAMVLPIRINGAQFSKFSYMRNKFRTQWFPKITLTFLEPRKFAVDPALRGHERRRVISSRIYDLMVDMVYKTSPIDEHLFRALLNSAAIHGTGHRIAEDINRKVMNYRQLINKSYLLGHVLCTRCPGEPVIGLMLPNTLANLVAFWGLQAYDRVPAMINFSSGPAQAVAACRAVQLKTIFTSRQFIEKARLEKLETALRDAGLNVCCLEDVKPTISPWEIGAAMFRALLRIKPKHAPNAPAAVLFTSGSEGMPKAVFLSHRNLLANRAQLLTVIPVNFQDRYFNALPMFHSFGLGVGAIVTVLGGIRTFYYPSPLHYRIIPELCYDTNATIICGTDSFMSGYGRMANPYDFFNMRFAIVGAEKLKPATADLWNKKFGIRIVEGYGATETSPVIAVNTPMNFRAGTVGRLLPGLEYRLDPVAGIETGGRLMLKGDSIMLGYMRHTKPGVLEPPPDGWYDTGDIVELDTDGYVIIKGRAKRFAKIAGEMVSLSAVEEVVAALYPKAVSGVVAIPETRKGEQLILVTTQADADSVQLRDGFRNAGMSELWVPRRVMVVKEPPLLGNGKFDFVTAQKMAEEKFSADGANPAQSSH